MRKNSDESLMELVFRVKKKYKEESDVDFPQEDALSIYKDEKRQRLRHFLFKTTGHLGDGDFLRFFDLLEDSGKTKKGNKAES